MGGQFYLFNLAADRSDDYSGAVIVSNIVLDYQDRSESVLFAPNDWGEISAEDISSMNFVRIHSNTSQIYCFAVEGWVRG